MIKDRYYYEMMTFIENELKVKNIDNALDEKTKKFFANSCMFISDVYNIINMLVLYLEANSCSKISFTDFQMMLIDYGLIYK